jgi:hypothetical protein
MFFLAFVCAAFSAVLNITKIGYNEVTIYQTDFLFVDLTQRVAVFLDVTPGELSAGFRRPTDSYTDYISVSVPEFSVAGSSISFRSSTYRSTLRFWLIPTSICSDLSNIALIATDNMMAIETGVESPACLFPQTTPSSYKAMIDTGVGIPHISFFSSHGRGEPVRTCIGETDLCTFETRDPFFVSFSTTTRLNFTYRVGGLVSGSVPCQVRGIPMIDNGSFHDVLPRIDNMGAPWCLSPQQGLIKAGGWMLVMMACVALLSMFTKVFFVNLKGKRSRGHQGGLLYAKLRETYARCA